MRRRLAGIAATLVLGIVPVIAVQAPALASVKVCTAAENKWCLDANSLAAGTPIVNGTGRDIILQDQHSMSGGREVYRLVFALNQTKCVGFSSNGLAEVRDCSGGDGSFVNWQNVRNGDGTTAWENTRFPAADCVTPNDKDTILTSNNRLGDRIFCSADITPGDLVRWTPSPTP